MKPEDIDKLETGRELDALIAERVMGWRITRTGVHTMYHDPQWKLAGTNYEEELPTFSADIAAAWEVVEKLREMQLAFSLDDRGDRLWDCYFSRDSMDFSSGCLGVDTAPLAICRAALKAVAGERDIRMVSRLDPQVARLLDQPNAYEPHHPEGARK